jgi:two-component system cell cycle response regulator
MRAELTRRSRMGSRKTWTGPPVAWWLLAMLLAAYAAMTFGVPADGAHRAARAALYGALLAGALALCASRAWTQRREAGAWIALGAALALWVGGDAAWSLGLSGTTFPGWADGLWLAGYPCAYTGLALLVRARWRGSLAAPSWLDGLLAATASAAVVAAVAPVTDGGSPLASALAAAYPLGDVILLTFAVGTCLVLGVREARALALTACGLGVYAIADAVRLLADGGSLALWPLGALLVGAAAVHPPTRVRAGSGSRAAGRLARGGRVVVALPALAVLVCDQHVHRLSTAAVDLALAALVLLVARLALSLRENQHLLATSRREALTDALTRLGNRRALVEELDRAIVRARDGEPQVLALFDLDGFKRYNDAFGHVAGDLLIELLGGRLGAACRGHGRAFRMGGDEFCVLAPAARAATVLGAASVALREAGEGFRVDASLGVVSLPDDADDAEAALQLADRRMYRHKERRPSSAASQSGDVLLRALGEREPELLAHTAAVTGLARAVAGALGLDPEERDVIARAAELHDIGKVAIPDAILAKPGPLDDDEREFMRRHTVIGEAIIEAAPALRPVAALVRASHERWDGSGYPDGLAGDAIPLGARIVAVCDAYSAMVQERAYGDVLAEAAALAELRRCAGTQFDPAVVAAFCALSRAVPAGGHIR